jgi:glycerol-3-phosphate dehydrogenase
MTDQPERNGLARRDVLSALRAQPEVSVLIVGGGINGIGVFRELALQGVDVLLVDKADFCSGASAASSHMIHGGLRYLENGEFRLVQESLRERDLLLQNAPHYVHPLPTTIPIFHWAAGLVNGARTFLRLPGRPSSRGALVVKIGLTLYDLFTRKQRHLPFHSFQSREQALALRPQLNPRIICTATYYDAWISQPERLGLELILDAEATNPQARALSYVRVLEAAGQAVTLHDEISGAALEVRPRVVINATGAWIDITNRTFQQQTRLIGGTKGSHLIIDHPELLKATGNQMVYYENADGRICIMFPVGGKVLVGSTDIPVDDPETVRCEDDEIDYMLESVRHVFPTIALDRSQIVFCYSGVRPLPHSDAATPGQISRNHRCALQPPGDEVAFPIYSLIGGKWTTFRAFGEQVADKVLPALGRARVARSQHLAIGGGREYPSTESARRAWLAALHQRTRLPLARLELLLQRYGTRAAEVAAFLCAGPDAPLEHHPDYSRREILFLATCERVIHLDDLVLRRTSIALLGQLTPALTDELAGIVAAALGWPPHTTRQEISRMDLLVQHNHSGGLRPSLPPASRITPQPALAGLD